MEFQLALPDDLGLSPANFVTAWNESSDCRTVALATLASSTSAHYYPFLIGGLAVLSSVGIGVGTNAIYDLIKSVFIKKGIHKHMQFTTVDQPDGTHILVVTIDEE